MIGFYLEAREVQNGRMVELVVYHGSKEGSKIPLGLLSFSPDEWKAFRPMIIGGMRTAALARVPFQLQDQTIREKPIRVVK